MQNHLLIIATMAFVLVIKGSDTPNIIFFVTDDMGFNDVGYNPNSELPTPTIDALAKEGIILNRYYVGPMCTPTRSSLLSGRYVHKIGMQRGVISGCKGWGLPTDIEILPEILSSKGYKTALFGKWHLGHHTWNHTPTHRGFDTFYGYHGAYIDYWGHNVTYEGWDAVDLFDNENPVTNKQGQYVPELFTEEAVKYIHSNAQTEEPLFIMFSQILPHFYLQPSPKYSEKCTHIENEKRRDYCALVVAADESLRNLTKALKDVNMWDNTILIFTSDNGGDEEYGGSNLPLRGQQSTHFEGGTRVPAFIVSPKLPKNARGTKTDLLVHVTDWLPTICHLISVPHDKIPDNDGLNIWPFLTLKNVEHTERQIVSLFGYGMDGVEWEPRTMSIRRGYWKLITTPSREQTVDFIEEVQDEPNTYLHDTVYQLFDLKKDPYEQTNLALNHPEIVNSLKQELEEELKKEVPYLWKNEPDLLCNPTLNGNPGVWIPWLEK